MRKKFYFLAFIIELGNILKLSLITVAYNAAETIGETLDSVASQTYRDFEHIVADGGSTDDTLKIVEERGKTVSKIISEPDEGVYDAMNKGIRAASGEVVGFLHANDLFARENVLADVARAFDVYNPDAVYGEMIYFRSSAPDDIMRYWFSYPYRKGLLKTGWFPPTPTIYLKREVYEKLGGFDLQYSISADFDLVLRAFEKYGASSYFLPKVLVKMRYGGVSNKDLSHIADGVSQMYNSMKNNDMGVSPLFILRTYLFRFKQLYKNRGDISKR